MKPHCNLYRKQLLAVLTAMVLLFGSSCSVKKIAVNKIGDSLANSGTTFAGDDDPELVQSALPFSLKLIEGLLAETPKHRGLLYAASSGFTQYAYAFVQQEGDALEGTDLEKSREAHRRARRLYLRARDYGLRGLEARHPGMERALRREPKQAVNAASRQDVPFLYWTAAAWGAAISLSKDDPELVSDQIIVEALIDRALQLDEKFENGAIHGFLITYEQARQGAGKSAVERSRTHFQKALDLGGGNTAAPYVSLAESVCIQTQDRSEFESLLNKALAIDPDRTPETRLLNLIMQKRARWLLSRADELFAETGDSAR